MPNNRIYLGIIGVLLVLVLILLLLPDRAETPTVDITEDTITLERPYEEREVIGASVTGEPISVHRFGAGDTDLLFVGGIHGGYEWNTVLLANEMIAYFEQDSAVVPENITVHIIPNLNPDGVATALGTSSVVSAEAALAIAPTAVAAGRFNANEVDLNRNFNCRWSPNGVWRGNTVSTGNSPFSEPEAVALRDYVERIDPAAAIFWHSQAGNVYGSECGEAVTAETLTLMNTYAEAAGYGAVPVFDAYVVAGAAEDWLASIGVPTVSVELETRNSSEFAQNLAGTLATLELYSE